MVSFCLLQSCGNESEGVLSDPELFSVVPAEASGLDFTNKLKDTKTQNIIEYLYYYNGGGVGVGDLDGDGLEDIVFAGNQVGDKIYRNLGGLKFEDITQASGVNSQGWSTGVNVNDFNGDGLMDIYICKVNHFADVPSVPNQLYINQGDGKFIEQAKELGLDFQGYSTHSCLIDYDQDGDLDLYLLNHAVHSIRSYGNTDKREEKDAVSGDRFYENRLKESGVFVDVTEEVGIYSSPLGYGLAVTAGDLNQDGLADIYVGNDFHENDYIYINNGDKTFSEVHAQAMSYSSQFSMGVDVADINQDGLLDIFSTDMMPFESDVAMKSAGEDSDQIRKIKDDLGFDIQNARNHMQINVGKGQFVEEAMYQDLYATDWSWSVLLQDFDNDSRTDIFISNGIVRRPNDLDYINFLNQYGQKDNIDYQELLKEMPSDKVSNMLFTQGVKGEFSSVVDAGINDFSFSTGASYADLDQDGDLDIITNNINSTASLIENKSADSTNYISFILKSDFAINGSKLFLHTPQGIQLKQVNPEKGFLSTSTHFVHFGLGRLSQVDSVVVHWPNGMKSTHADLTTNSYNNIEYKAPSLVPLMQMNHADRIPAEPFDFKHVENNFNDEDVEKLIPERLSREGPAVVVDDFNGDGVNDVFLGGARNQEARLYFGDVNGKYKPSRMSSFEQDKKYEDAAAAAIDFDGDGDLDIYVVSGGGEQKELDKLLEDRLYLNNGKKGFKRIPISLPHTNGSCIAIGDFDNDGYKDIFVGARSIPTMYGFKPYSFILKNNGGQGVTIAKKVRYGMITDAKWADYDQDDDLDLFLCGDWMSVRVEQNQGDGSFVDATPELGLNVAQGFWNVIELVDLDKDGHLDILAGNTGLNHKWKTNDDQPIKMYVGDFDKNGAPEPIIFHHSFDRYKPFASLNKLVGQVPILRKKYQNYASFHEISSVNELFEDYQSNLVESLVVNEMRSVAYMWKDGSYVLRALPTELQKTEIRDFAQDDKGNIIYVGNNGQFVSDLGPTLHNAAGLIKGVRDNEPRLFDLPLGVEARKIERLSADKYLIVCNNTQSYVVSIR